MSRTPPPERAALLAAVEAARSDVTFSTTLRGRSLRFTTTWGLFSPREVDLGSSLLIDTVEVRPEDDCADVGCGYGAIGLTLAALAPRGQTLLLDKDFVAVDYANRNATANHLENARAMLSNGFSHVESGRTFDLVTANLPAKAGNEMLEIMLADAYLRLRPGGRLTVVTLSNMRHFIDRTMVSLFGNAEKVKQGRLHTVTQSVREAEQKRSGGE